MTPVLLAAAGATALVTLVTNVVHHRAALRAHGSVHLTRDETLALMAAHGGLRALARLKTGLQLLTGGLVIAAGLWVKVTENTAPLIDTGLLH